MVGRGIRPQNGQRDDFTREAPCLLRNMFGASMSSYILCKFEGFSKRTSSKLFIWNVSLKFSKITEIVMRFPCSEISFYYLHQIITISHAKEAKNVNKDSPI